MPPNVRDVTIISKDAQSRKDIGLVFSALPEGVARSIEAELAKKKFFIVSKASDQRMEEDVPLLIPMNADHC